MGPRKASGVRQTRTGGALRGGAKRERSNISGLADLRPFTWCFIGGSALNGSESESCSGNSSDSVFTANISASGKGIQTMF